MSAIIMLPRKQASEIFDTLAGLLPSKTEAVPLGLRLSNNTLRLTYSGGYRAVYEAPVSSDDEWETTFSYHDISSFIMGDTVRMEIDEFSVTVTCEGSEFVFPIAYSEVSCPDYSDMEFTAYSSDKVELNAVLRLGLEKLYKTSYPIYIRNGIGIVKYPSFYVQVRLSMPLTGVTLSLNHLDLISKFDPTELSDDKASQYIVFRKDHWYLVIPSSSHQDDNNFKKLLEGMDITMQAVFKDYNGSLRALARMKGLDSCSVKLLDNGLVTSVSVENATASVNLGNQDGEVIAAFQIPLNVWIAMTAAVGETTAELLYGGGKLCLRNHLIAMLIRVVA